MPKLLDLLNFKYLKLLEADPRKAEKYEKVEYKILRKFLKVAKVGRKRGNHA